MNIVFLDAKTTNSGDFSWTSFDELGNFVYYDRTANNMVIERALNADVIITNKTVISRDIIAQLPKLKYICIAATGVNVVDLNAAKERGIPVSNVVGYSTNSVVQIVFGHILNLVTKIEHQADIVNSGCWVKSLDFTYCDFPIFELSNMNIGIVGFGNVGRAVGKVAHGFNMTVNVFKPGTILEKPDYVNIVDKDTLFRTSDVLTLHCPLCEDTVNFINNDTIGLMKKSAHIINTGRGGLIEEQALADALNNGRLAGAGLDVLSSEPPLESNPLLNSKNCKITPHIAWTSVEARRRLLKALVDNIKHFTAGFPINVVNK
jgi:glycerate dehydrogenase